MTELENNQQTLAIESAQKQTPAYIEAPAKERKSLKEMYYQWLLRLTVLLCMVCFAFFLSASLVLFKMAPQVTVKPFLIISQDSSDMIVRYEAIEQDMPSKKQIMETFIKQYIILRNSVINDEREMQARWFAGGVVNYLSAPQVYIDFNQAEVEKLTTLLTANVVRDVEIISLGKVGGEKSPVWKVDFKVNEVSYSGEEGNSKLMVLKTHYWTASLTAAFIPARMFMAKRLMNPLGFTVLRYSQTEVEIL